MSETNQIEETVTVGGKEYQVVKELKQNTDQSFNRVTIVESIYHENNEGPAQINTPSFSYQLTSDEQAYTRIMTVKEEWVPLDTGWLDGKVSMIHLFNMEGKIAPVRLSEEQKADIQSRVIELGISCVGPKPVENGMITCSYLSPRKSIRLETKGLSENLSQRYYLRCLSGSCKVQVSCLPA